MAVNDNLINVPGYAQTVFYNDGIQYRNFSPDLVGNQYLDSTNTPLFTYGNFAVLKNMQGRVVTNYPSKPYGNFITLNSINGSQQVIDLIFNSNVKINLNIDATKIDNFAYFGSSTEFIRVTLESIITKWPASIYLTPLDNQNYSGVYTVEDYVYNSYYNTSKFKVKNNTFINNYDVIYNIGGANLVNYDNAIRNLVVNYKTYNILYNNSEYPLIEFTGSTYLYDDYVYLTVNGNPFPEAVVGPQYLTYHIKPNNLEVEKFFSSLTPFENNLLNRLTLPKYKSIFDYTQITDDGTIYSTSKSLVWPTSDGYNLDFSTNEYVNYVTQLLEITNSLDETKTDLMVRFLVAESISNFDTVPRCDGTEEETAGQKMTKTLRIYGREFDEIKQYINGIAYANNITYDRKANAPDQMVKYIARVLGWELTSSVVENDLLKAYLDVPESTYSGQSRGLTAAEAEIELWRRLILNSAWLFKSKGTRKAIEFLFKFIGAPEGLINLNEHIYAAKGKIDMDLFYAALEANNLDTTLNDTYNITEDGYPRALPNTLDMYFQKGGLWYRETGGQNAANHILQGNNPHIGPYDGGYQYINQFRSLIPDFQPTVLTSSTYTTSSVELFTNYNNGLINNYTGDTYVDVETWSGVTLEDCFLYVADIIHDPHPSYEQTACGCDLPADDLSLYIDIKRDEYTEAEQYDNCSIRISGYTYVNNTNPNFYNEPFVYNWNYITYNPNGTANSQYYVSPFISPTCCKVMVGGLSYLHDEYVINTETGRPTLTNSGYVCCKVPPTRPIGGSVPFTDFGFATVDPKTATTNRGITKTLDMKTPISNGNGCGCYIGCQWRLAGPLLGNMYSYNNNIYLKFVTPLNYWGTTGSAEYRVSVESDSCICPPIATTPEIITDPYTNKVGYGCKLTDTGKKLLTLSQENVTYGTTNNQLYQLFYQKSVGTIGCTSYILKGPCIMSLEPLPQIAFKNNEVSVTLPQILNGTAPYTYLWEIVTQTGLFSNYIILSGNTSESPQFGPLNGIVAGGDGMIEIKINVTDSNGCKASTNGIVYAYN
jgi:hypothetical protein